MNELADKINVEAVNKTLGENLRQLRINQGFTLDELVLRSGLSKGMLVQLEKAGTNPSIGTLTKLANALGVTISRLIESPSTQLFSKVHIEELDNFWRGDGDSVAKLLGGVDGADLIELWDWQLEPGQGHSSASHPHGTKEILYVLKGSISINVDENETTINEMEALQMPADKNHHYKNISKIRSHFIMLVVEPKRIG